MQYKEREITKELLEAAQKCKNTQELIKFAEENGVELSVAEAEAFLDEFADAELDADALDQAAGGKKKGSIGTGTGEKKFSAAYT